MTVELKPGTRLRSAVCTTEVIVVKSPSAPVEIECGGAPMLPATEQPAGGVVDPARAEGTLIGKRYVHEAAGLEVLCTKAGDGSLSAGGDLLPQKDAKPLPSSD